MSEAAFRSAARSWLDATPPGRAALAALRRVRRSWQRTNGVSWTLAGQRYRFAAGTEPGYLNARESHAQQANNRQIELIARLIRPGDVVYDIGAYIGLYTLIAARAVGPRGRVVAFEPVPASIACLRENLRINRLSAVVQIEPCAAGHVPGSLAMRVVGVDSRNTLTASALAFSAGEAVETIEVPIVAIDDYCRRSGRGADLVKIDVEGWELSVLEGMSSLLRGPCTVLCEMHPQLWQSYDDVRRRLFQLIAASGRRIVDFDGNEPGTLECQPYLLARILP